MNDRRKSIGIIGGAGPMAGILLLEYIIQICQTKYHCKDDEDFPMLILFSVPFAQMLKPNSKHQNEIVVQEQLQGALHEIAGYADHIGIACNTLHSFMHVENHPSLVSMIQLTDEYLNKNSIRSPLVLGTSTSFLKNVHDFRHRKYTSVTEQVQLDQIIDLVLAGHASLKIKKMLEKLILACLERDNHVDGIVLACTELSVLINKYGKIDNHPFHVIDPLILLAQSLCSKVFESNNVEI